MIKKIDLSKHVNCIDLGVAETVLNIGIEDIARKLNEVIDAVNKIEGALSDLGNSTTPFVDIAKGLRGNGLSGKHIPSHTCNCHAHRHGERTGGWYCPKHGPQL